MMIMKMKIMMTRVMTVVIITDDGNPEEKAKCVAKLTDD